MTVRTYHTITREGSMKTPEMCRLRSLVHQAQAAQLAAEGEMMVVLPEGRRVTVDADWTGRIRVWCTPVGHVAVAPDDPKWPRGYPQTPDGLIVVPVDRVELA